MKLITREQWGARPRGSGAANPFSPDGCAVHYEGVGWAWPWGHDTCDDKVRAIQDYHMDGRGWSDIAYNFLACPHSYVFEGRGLNRRSAANGDFATNTAWYAVQCMWGTKSGSVPAALLTAGRDAIDYCRASGGAGPALRGHRDFKATECPGDQLYAWVRAGAPRPKTTPPTPPEEDMPLTVEDAELVVDRLLARKLSDDAGSVNNVFTTGFGRITYTYDTLRENGAINSQLDAIHATLTDEDAQTDRIETAVTKPLNVQELADAIAAAMPASPDVQTAVEVGLRNVLGGLDET